MAVQTTNNKPINPRGNDQSPKGYNRAALYSGKALDFDGVNDSISVPYSDTLGGVWTWVSIIEPDALSGYQELFGGQYGSTNATIYLKENQLSFYTTGNNFNTAFNFETGKKYHVACSQSGDTISVYVNGQAAGSVSLTIPLNRTGGVYIIGKNPTQSIEYFNGKMSGVKLFNTALTAAQVADLYNNPEKIVPTGVDESNLKLWLPMQEGAGTTAYDGSGGGNHGTISGATWTHGIGAPVAQTAVIDWNKGSNLMVYSEEFDSGVYGGSNFVVNANATTAPDGKNTADKITFTATGVTPEIFDQFTNVANTMHIGSVFLKNDTIGSVQLEIIGGGPGILGQTTIDLTDGSLSASVGDYTPVATDAGNGWYRVSVGDTGSATIASPSLKIKHVGTDGAFYAWGIQVEAADSLGAYIPNHTNTAITSPVLLPQGLTTGRDITGVNLFENVRKQGALNLDGNSWAEVHDNASLDITDAITLEAWVYNSGENNKGLLGRWFSGTACYMLYKPAADNNFNFYINSNYVTSGTVTARDWHHVVGVYDGATKKIYVNGVEEGSSAETATINTSSDPIEIGRFYGGPDTRTLANQLAQPRIYNRALTAEEIERNYTAGKYTYNND